MLHAQTYYVDVNLGDDNAVGSFSNPWGNIDTAINRLNTGDTLFIRGGDYTSYGQITFQKNGTSTQPIVISGYQNEYPLVQGFTIGYSSWLEIKKIDFKGPQTLPVGWLDMPNIVIDNPAVNTNDTITWSSPGFRVDSILTKYSSYANFFNYAWNTNPTWESNASYGLNIVDCQNIEIIANKFSLHTYGIRIRNNSKYININQNEFTHCLDAIAGYCDVGSYQYSFGFSSITNNDITQSLRNGIMLNYGANNNLIDNNIVTYSGQNHISTFNLDILSDSAGYNTVSNNFVAYGGYYADFMKFPGPSGISLHSPGPGTKAIGNYIAYQVTNAYRKTNLIDGNGLISDNNPHGSEFINNVCFRPMGNGFSIVKAKNNTFVHNTVIHAGYGDPTSLNNGMAIKIVESGDTNNVIYNNIFTNAERGGIYSQHPTFSSQTAIDYNLYYGISPFAADSFYTGGMYNTIPYEINGLNIKPDITDSLGNISNTSPAILAGNGLYSYPTDKIGTSRNSSQPTIGAYENSYVLGIEDVFEDKKEYRVYPNPATNILIVPPLLSSKTNLNELFKLYSLNGVLVYQKSISTSEVNFIRLDTLNSGTYIYQYGAASGKIIKQ
ncbi:MAG: T9SS type A sorting domain-containing protein [Candidatus Kapabacteria bacterium]|nr:T9SS type A sorting domain-containing protein [Candidatus Kapabacteria bacterium]